MKKGCAVSGAALGKTNLMQSYSIAKALKDASLAVNLRIVAFDQEENGLVGSAAYARQLNDAGRMLAVGPSGLAIEGTCGVGVTTFSMGLTMVRASQ